MGNVAGFLVRCKERDDYLPGTAALAAQTVLHHAKRKIIAEMLAQFFERQSGRVPALAAVRPIEIRIIDMCERRGLELGVFHVLTIAPDGCGLLMYNSYSIGGAR